MATEDPGGESARRARERDILQHEVDYRRERRYKIFTWTTTLLVAVIGLIALPLRGTATLGLAQKLVLTTAVVVLTVYSALWWQRQRAIGREFLREITRRDAETGFTVPDAKSRIPEWIGGATLMLVLGVAAVAAIWVPTQ